MAYLLSDVRSKSFGGFLNQRVKITGLMGQFNGKPRLMQVERIEPVIDPKNGNLFEYN